MTVTNVTPPVISGTARVGQTLITTQGTWTFSLDYLTYAYAWLRCNAAGASCTPIGGQTAIQYVLTSSDIGSTIRSEVTATEHSGGGATTDFSPGGAVAAINAAAPGDTLRAIGGSHPQFTLPKSFPSNDRLTITVQAGSYFVGIDTGSQDGYTFDTCVFTRPLNTSNQDDAALYLHGASSNISVIDCVFTGGFYCIKGYCSSASGYLDNILIQGCDISAAGEDLTNFNGIRNSIIDSNYFHNPVFHSGSHQDCIQFPGALVDGPNNNITISNNHFYGTTVSGNNSQCIQTGRLFDSLIVNNLFDHWNGGKAINIDHGSQRIKVVNNTVQDLPVSIYAPSISLNNGTGTTTQIEIWNNIVQGIYVPTSSMLTICSTNWYTGNSAQGGNALGLGVNYQQGSQASLLFVNTTDYDLQAGSPARNYGIIRLGSPTDDRQGNTRPAAPIGLGCMI